MASEGPVPAPDRPGRALGLDFGQRRIGVAVSDDRRRIATPLVTVLRSKSGVGADHRALVGLMIEEAVTVVVVGMPFSLSGRLGPAAALVAEEVGVLQSRLSQAGSGLAVVTHDERRTTVTAAEQLRASGRKSGSSRARKERSVIDQLAAAVMLQSWLDSQSAVLR